MTSQDFWTRKLNKQHQDEMAKTNASQRGLPLVQKSTDQPWWRVVPQQSIQQTVSQQEDVFRGQPFQQVHLTDDIVVTLDENGEYRPKKATHLKRSGLCPDCGSGNFGRGENRSIAPRCFDCGYVEGRNIADINRPVGATSDQPAQRARQVSAGGARVDNYHGNIKTASEAAAYIGGV